ncbi:hypothetical protein DFH09DRAFT_1127047 [Mycena vulgaris]|nr:hypothetical protein DFH09DRAFT_1127047 [Mycena vulgaris]
MHPMRWIAFGLYLFSQLGGSHSVAIPMRRRSAFIDSAQPEPTASAVLPGQASAVLSNSTNIFTKNPVVTGTSVILVSIPTVAVIQSPMAPRSSINTDLIGASIGAGLMMLGIYLGLSALMHGQKSSSETKIASGNETGAFQELQSNPLDSDEEVTRAAPPGYAPVSQS